MCHGYFSWNRSLFGFPCVGEGLSSYNFKESRRHRTLWHRTPSHVQRHGAALSGHAPGAGLSPLLRGDAAVSAHHRKAHPQRGEGALQGTGGLPGLLPAREIPPLPGDLVRKSDRRFFP